MRHNVFASLGPRHRRRSFTRLAALLSGVLALGVVTAVPAHARHADLIARDRAVFEYNDATVRIVLARRVRHGVSVGFGTIPGTATEGLDYLGKSGRVHFPPGTRVQKVRILVLDDNVDEPAEHFQVRLFAPRRASLVDRTARVTIVDNDPAQTLSVGDASVHEGGVLSFPVRLSRVTPHSVSFRYATTPVTASTGDFVATSGFGSIPTGASQTTVLVSTVEDHQFEPAETLRLQLSDVSGAAPGDLEGIGTIVDDDSTPQLRINDVSVSEGDSTSLTVSLSSVSTTTTRVSWRTTQGSARENQDYVRASGTLTIPAGSSSGSITVQTIEDSIVDLGEVFYIDLSSPVGASIADARGVVTIIDDDHGPTLTVADTSAVESQTMSFTVRLSHDPSHNVSFTWSTVDGSAAAPADFTAVTSRNETITSGTTKTITVNLVNDDVDEVDETFGVVITNVVGATVGDNHALGLIIDDDKPVLSVPATASVVEGASVTIRVTLALASSETVTVNYATASGSGPNKADQGTDFDPASGTLTFTPGQTTKDVTVKTTNDADTSSETFSFSLSSPSSNARLGNSTTTVTITPSP